VKIEMLPDMNLGNIGILFRPESPMLFHMISQPINNLKGVSY